MESGVEPTLKHCYVGVGVEEGDVKLQKKLDSREKVFGKLTILSIDFELQLKKCWVKLY